MQEGNPLDSPRPVAAMIDGGRWRVSNPIAATGGATTRVMGVFRNVVFGMTGGIAMEASMEAVDASGSAWMQGQVWILAYAMLDVAILRPDHFCKISNVTV